MPRTVEPVVEAGALTLRAQPTLRLHGRALLRPWAEHDAERVVTAFEVTDIQRWHNRRLDLDEARQWIAGWGERWRDESDASWAISARDTDRMVGYVALRKLTLEVGYSELSYWVLPEARGQGLATAAARAVTRWAFDELGLHRIEVLHAVANEPSCAVAQRAGFVLEGTHREVLLHTDGWHDVHLHARLATD